MQELSELFVDRWHVNATLPRLRPAETADGERLFELGVVIEWCQVCPERVAICLCLDT